MYGATLQLMHTELEVVFLACASKPPSTSPPGTPTLRCMRCMYVCVTGVQKMANPSSGKPKCVSHFDKNENSKQLCPGAHADAGLW